jgi:hypothetical protein
MLKCQIGAKHERKPLRATDRRRRTIPAGKIDLDAALEYVFVPYRADAFNFVGKVVKADKARDGGCRLAFARA